MLSILDISYHQELLTMPNVIYVRMVHNILSMNLKQNIIVEYGEDLEKLDLEKQMEKLC